MNISRKNRLLIVLGIAFLFILYGVAGLIFKFTVDKKIENYISLVLMGIAVLFIFVGRKKNNNENQSNITEKENNVTIENNDKKQSGE